MTNPSGRLEIGAGEAWAPQLVRKEDYTMESDCEVLTKCVDGKLQPGEVTEHFLNKYVGRVRNYAVQHSRRGTDVDDLVQIVYLVLLTTLSNPDELKTFWNRCNNSGTNYVVMWLLIVCRNRLLESYRKDDRNPGPLINPGNIVAGENHTDLCVDLDLVNHIEEILNGLPKKQQDALKAWIECGSYRAAGEQLEVPHTTVSDRCNKAISEIRKQLKID